MMVGRDLITHGFGIRESGGDSQSSYTIQLSNLGKILELTHESRKWGRGCDETEDWHRMRASGWSVVPRGARGGQGKRSERS